MKQKNTKKNIYFNHIKNVDYCILQHNTTTSLYKDSVDLCWLWILVHRILWNQRGHSKKPKNTLITFIKIIFSLQVYNDIRNISTMMVFVQIYKYVQVHDMNTCSEKKPKPKPLYCSKNSGTCSTRIWILGVAGTPRTKKLRFSSSIFSL